MYNLLARILVLLYVVTVCSCTEGQLKKSRSLEIQENTTQFIEAGWNGKDISVVDSFMAEPFTRRVNNVPTASNRKELAANMQVYITAFPDLHLTIDDVVATDDHVILNWTIRGTNTGIFGEIQATGKKVTVSGITRMDFNEAGKIVYEDVFFNELSLLQQLGHRLIPPEVE